MLNVIFIAEIKLNTVSGAFWSKFYKPSLSYPSRFSNLNSLNTIKN